MKYLKLFEEKKEFNVGDYVVAEDWLIRHLKEVHAFKAMKRMKDNVGVIIMGYTGSFNVSYLSDDDYDTFNQNELRFATPEEIEGYKEKENIIKYNL